MKAVYTGSGLDRNIKKVMKEYFLDFEIKPLETNSGVSETPIGDEEGICGCFNRIKDAIKGWGTKDHLLIRILITRDEIDMPAIKQYFKQLYGKDVIEHIKEVLPETPSRRLMEAIIPKK